MRHQATWLTVAMVGIATYLYFLRSPTTLTSAALWAEDGTVFFRSAIEEGWRQVLVPYAGQLYAFQRVIAAAVSPLPVAIQPSLYAAAAIVAAVLSCSLILSPRMRTSAPLGIRFVGLLALVCAPALGETHGTLANLHWWLGVGLLLMGLMRDPVRRSVKLAEILFAVTVVLSGFAAIYGVPTLLVRASRNRSRHSLALLGIVIAGLALQSATLLGSPRRGDVTDILLHPLTALLVLAKDVVATAVLGASNLATVWPGVEPGVLGMLSVIALVGALAVAWRHGARLDLAALLLVILGGWALALWPLTQPGGSIDMLLGPSAAERYFLVPRAALLISVVIAWPPARGGHIPFGVAAACVLLAGGILSDYHLLHVPSVGWDAFARCVDDGGELCTTTVPPGWTLEVTPPRH